MEKRDVQFSAIHALQSRFLYPFFFRRQKVHEAVKALLEDDSQKGRDGQRLTMWECPKKPHALYQEEVLDHVVKFFFPYPDTAGCQYLKLSDAVGSRWFGHLEVQLPGNVMVPLRLVAAAGVELFLSDYGVGILSIALEPHKGDLSAVEAMEFNYRLSQLRCSNLILHVPHPAEDPQRWARLSTETQQNIPPAPDPQAPLEARLGKPGGVFTPKEMVDTLLQPLTQPLTDFCLRQVQDRLSVYTVVRCGAEVDFEREEVRASYAPLLSSLAQVEESTHAGAPTDALGITHIILNRRHWAGVGLLGAVHLIADQPPPEHWEVALVLSASADVYLIADQSPPEHPFNTARTLRIFLKYFMLYLSALLQRHTLHHIVDEACGIVRTPPQDKAAKLASLRGHLLEFTVSGHFTHVSTREALHRYYRLCQEGLDVRPALDDARRAISDLDAQYTTERHIRVAEDTATNVAATRKLQERAESIEILVVSVYFAHLWHMLVGHKREHPIWLDSEVWGLPLWSWGVLVVALLALGFMIIYHKLHPEDETA